MKKLVLSIVAIFAIVLFANAQDSSTFNLSMTVDEYIECTSGPIAINFGTTSHNSNAEQLFAHSQYMDLAYANCPFSITISGDNAASEGVPRFVRQETGTYGGDYDTLPTHFDFHIGVNNIDYMVNDGAMGNYVPAKDFPISQDFNEAPHNGQIRLWMGARVNNLLANSWTPDIPIRKTLIDQSMTKVQSADAGDYACTMTITLAAI